MIKNLPTVLPPKMNAKSQENTLFYKKNKIKMACILPEHQQFYIAIGCKGVPYSRVRKHFFFFF